MFCEILIILEKKTSVGIRFRHGVIRLIRGCSFLEIMSQPKRTAPSKRSNTQFTCTGMRKLYRFFCFVLIVSHFWGGRGFGGSRIDADIQSRPITYHEGKPDSSCVVAIKMRSLYFVTLKNFYICV